MAKRNHNLAPVQNERGQISIFFSASLIVMISIVAFVINIGLFVKAKINLQNATDAAAYAGASVQARQLSKIAYLNWEMRNIYKEWMYKYYVIGNLNINDVENPNMTGTAMQFKLQKDREVLSGLETEDQFNIPAVCIHISKSKTNICKRYSVPGLPEFGSSNLVGAEEASRAFMDTLISTKVNDCVDRTRLNMAVATTWTYNVLGNEMDESMAGFGPAILSDKQGAWPQAVELAVRMRNLEFMFNRPAETNGVCVSGSTNGVVNCSKSIGDITAEKKLGNERLIKAFYSGYRNLGNDQDNEMKNSFTLREIAPKTVKIDSPNNASNLLLPSKSIGYPKQYLDLKLMMVNYAIFYAAMIPRATSKESGACDISKVAIPVPGYPIGFYKNPDVLTYYAVKGEAEFVGMFNPFFGSGNIVKMTAYSAAKPFGGRIGPMLFTQNENEDFIRQRNDPLKYRSVPYITSHDFTGASVRGHAYTGNNFIPGLPLPTNSTSGGIGSFWLKEGSPVGGLVTDTAGVSFGVPNMVYDYETLYQLDGYSDPSQKIHTISATNASTEKSIGLYSKYQFNKFRGNALTPTITPETLDHEIARVRAPTIYEAANYLVPTPFEFNNAHDLDSFGFIAGEKEDLNNGYERYHANIYAPLYQQNSDQQDILYKNSAEVLSSILEFMRAQQSGMKKYKMALNQAAKQIFDEKENVSGGATGSKEGYIRAANGVSDINFANPDLNQTPKTCNSLAGQFLYFYWAGVENSLVPGDEAGCPVSLGDLLTKYFAGKDTDAKFDPNYYPFKLSWKKGMSKEEGLKYMTAYAPGPFTGVSFNAEYTSPFPGSAVSNTMRRNTYSTKFISLDSLQPGSGPRWSNTFPVLSEGSVEADSGKESAHNFKNPLEADAAGLDLTSIKY